MSTIDLAYLQRADDPDLAQVFDRVFRPSFDEHELPDISFITPNADRIVLVARDETGIVGGGVSDASPGAHVGLLSYLATNPAERSRGVGTLLLRGLRERWSVDNVAVVVGEVRDPRAWPTTDDERPEDRLHFYARNECHMLPAPWAQPGLEGGPREPGMLLLTIHDCEIGEIVASEPMVEWAAAYYAASEGGTPTDDEYLRIIDGLSKRLEVRAIDDYRTIPLL